MRRLTSLVAATACLSVVLVLSPGTPSVYAATCSAYRVLNSVSALSATDVWAVGYAQRVDCTTRTLIEHWTGASWSRAKSPNPAADSNLMTGVSFVSASNGWAVGFTTDVPGDVSRTLIAHWNGKSWSQVQSPNRGDLDNDLQGVSALSRGDAWAVGTSAVLRNGTRCFRTLALHWDGNKWSKMPSPSPSAAQNNLIGVDMYSSTDVWTVGYRKVVGIPGVDLGPLVLHFDGVGWSEIATPKPSTSWELSDVSAVSLSDVWAVGVSGPGDGIIFHWDGSEWSQVLDPALSDLDLYGVSAVSATDVWAVGASLDGTPGILHWDGTNWISSSIPTFPSGTVLVDAGGIAADDAWVVGYNGGDVRLRWDGSTWSNT